jgi:hypothetical protein
MNAISIIERIRGAGGVINLAEESIKLQIPASLRDGVVADIKKHKDAIKRALRTETMEPWDAKDWQAYFDEKAAISEFDGGQLRGAAETTAFECCVVEWLSQNPVRSDPRACFWCHKPGSDGAAIAPFGIAIITWLHPSCWPKWNSERRSEAGRALSEIGMRLPPLAGASGSAPGS